MADHEDDRLMPEKTVEWLQDEALRRCRTRLGCSDLQTVRIGPTKPEGSGPNWELLAFIPELDAVAHYEAMDEIHKLRGMYALAKRK